MKIGRLAGLIVAAVAVTAMTQAPAYVLEADESTLSIVDCGYHGSETDMGHKNTIASNIDWGKYGPGGNDSAVALMALKFRGAFPAEEAAWIRATVNGDTVGNARFLSDNDTARLFMLFVPSSAIDGADTLRLSHPSMGAVELPAINFKPRGVYTVEIRRIAADTIK